MSGKWMCFLVRQEDIKDNRLSYCAGVKPDEKSNDAIEIYANKDGIKTFTVNFFDYCREYPVPANAKISAKEYKEQLNKTVEQTQKDFEEWLKKQKRDVEQNTHDLYGDKTYIMMNFVQHPLTLKMDATNNRETDNKIIAWTKIAFDSFSVDEIRK